MAQEYEAFDPTQHGSAGKCMMMLGIVTEGRWAYPVRDLAEVDAEVRLRQESTLSDIRPNRKSETGITPASIGHPLIHDSRPEREQRLKEAQAELASLPLNGPEYMAQLGVVAKALREVRNG